MNLTATLDRWPLLEPFSISRFTFTDSLILTVTIEDSNGFVGHGECEPHEYDESFAAAAVGQAGIDLRWPCRPAWLRGVSRENLALRLPRSPIRNAVDCALWDLEAKQRGVRANAVGGLPMDPVKVLPTLGIDLPEVMAKKAASFRGAEWLKVKLGCDDGLDAERLEAIAAALPGVPLLVDANGGWSLKTLTAMLPLAQRLGVRMIEQPMVPCFNDCMPKPPSDLIFCADESCLDRESLPGVLKRFQAINIKLDKAGGLTESLALRDAAERLGLGVMVGMMSGTSLAVAPALLLAQGLDVVDLELGFLRRDREHAMRMDDFVLQPPQAALWG